MSTKVKPKRIIDISCSISPDTYVWPGDKEVTIDQSVFISKGALYNLSSFSMSMHVGTHIDVPLHFFDDGCDTSNVDLNLFTGMAKVISVMKEDSIIIEDKDLEKFNIEEDDIIIIKTINSIKENNIFNKDFVSLSESAAQYLINKKIRSVGIDYISIEKYGTEDAKVHKLLLSAGLGIIEGLALKDVEDGEYFLESLPLKIAGGNGSPVRAVLLEF